MKKNNFLFFILIVICNIAIAQKNSNEIDNWKKLSQNSLILGDWNTFILSNHFLYVIDAKNDSLYSKNILYGYFENRQYESCFLLSKKLIEVDKLNITYLDFYARSAEALQRYGDATIAYEKLYIYTLKVNYGYLLANAQYYLGRYVESMQTLQALKTNKECQNIFLNFTSLSNNKTQSVPISAALYNLEGMNYYEMKNIESSKKSFIKAIELFPEFEVAKDNLESIH